MRGGGEVRRGERRSWEVQYGGVYGGVDVLRVDGLCVALS